MSRLNPQGKNLTADAFWWTSESLALLFHNLLNFFIPGDLHKFEFLDIFKLTFVLTLY